MPARQPLRAVTAPGDQVAPAPADQRQVGDVTHPHLVGAQGRGLVQQLVLGPHGGRVGLRGRWGQVLSARHPLARSQVRKA